MGAVPHHDTTQPLCRLEEIPDGGSRGFTLAHPDGRSLRVFAVRRGASVVAYVNSCPHRGTPLDWQPDEFLDREGRYIEEFEAFEDEE